MDLIIASTPNHTVTERRAFLAINVIGGAAVLGSYAWGIATYSGDADGLWGGIAGRTRWLYLTNMVPATTGYLLMFAFLLRNIGSAQHPTSILAWYTTFVASSALWMPLTVSALEQNDPDLLRPIQLILAIAGAASIGIFVCVARVKSNTDRTLKVLALVGGAFLVLQCAVLDAIIWARYFELP